MNITFDIEQLVPRFIMADQNGRAMAKAIEKAFEYIAKAAEDGLDIIMDVEKMPEWRLDEMATEYGVPYDYTAQVDQKRTWIRNAIPMYQIFGTKEAIRQYLVGYFGEVEVQENWEYSGDPYHFHVTVGGEWTPETETWARKAIERVKSVRSVLDDLRIGCMCSLGITATGDVKHRWKYPYAGELTAGEYPTENILFIPDHTPLEGRESGDWPLMIEYPMCGELVCGE